MNTSIIQADSAALRAYFRAHDDGVPHVLALNIAVSVWFRRCPHTDSR